MTQIGPELQRSFYASMCRTREAEERLELLHKQGHVGGGVYRSLGQEAGPVGAAHALRRRIDGTGDFLGQAIRAVGALFLFGGTPLEYFRQYLSRGTSPTAGHDANLHFSDYQRGFVGPVSPLGTMVGVMAGITLSFRLRGEDRVGLVFYGDGASSTGAWHEGLSVAAAQRCPMILMVEANQWAFSTPTSAQTRVGSFVEKGPFYGVHAVSVDGNDVEAVYRATSEVAARAREGGGPQMIELRTFRRLGHAQHDPAGYVDPEDLAAWVERDPIDRYYAHLVGTGVATEEELEAIRNDIREEIRKAADQALAEPPPEPLVALEGVYASLSVPTPWTRRSTPDPKASGRVDAR